MLSKSAFALMAWSALLTIGAVEAQTVYSATLFPSNAVCAPAQGTNFGAITGCFSEDGVSVQLLLQPGTATPPLYTYTVYNAPGCNPASLITGFVNVPQDGTTCVTNSVGVLPLGTSSFILTNTQIATTTTTTTTTVTLNVGAIVGAVLGGLAVIVGLAVFCRYKELFCFARPSFTPAPVMNPAAIVVK